MLTKSLFHHSENLMHQTTCPILTKAPYYRSILNFNILDPTSHFDRSCIHLLHIAFHLLPHHFNIITSIPISSSLISISSSSPSFQYHHYIISISSFICFIIISSFQYNCYHKRTTPLVCNRKKQMTSLFVIELLQ